MYDFVTQNFRIYRLLLLMILTTSALGLSKLWGCGIPTSNIFHYAPRIRRLLLLFNLALPPHFFFYRFLDCSFPPLSYLLPVHSRSSLIPYKCSLTLHLLYWCEALTTWTSTAPADRHPLPLVPVPRVVCLRLL